MPPRKNINTFITEDHPIFIIKTTLMPLHHLLSVILLTLLCTSPLQADTIPQKNANSPFDVSLEISTKYMWRAIEYGNAPTGFAIINFEHQGFSAYAEGVYAFNGSHQEVDLGIAYTWRWLNVGVNDYYYPSAVGEKDKYFKLASRETGHYLEGAVTVAPESLPLWLTFSTYFWGADKKPSGRQAYSSYVELGYTHAFNNDNSLSLAMGANLNKGFYTDYEHGFNVVNVTAKYATSFKFGKYRLPVSASYVLNPFREKSFVTFSMYFNSKL